MLARILDHDKLTLLLMAIVAGGIPTKHDRDPGDSDAGLPPSKL